MERGLDCHGQRPCRSPGHESCIAMDGSAKNKGDRPFAVSLAADPTRAPAFVVHRAGMLASPRCSWTLQHALHELVTRSREGTGAPNHSIALTRSDARSRPSTFPCLHTLSLRHL